MNQIHCMSAQSSYFSLPEINTTETTSLRMFYFDDLYYLKCMNMSTLWHIFVKSERTYLTFVLDHRIIQAEEKPLDIRFVPAFSACVIVSLHVVFHYAEYVFRVTISHAPYHFITLKRLSKRQRVNRKFGEYAQQPVCNDLLFIFRFPLAVAYSA